MLTFFFLVSQTITFFKTRFESCVENLIGAEHGMDAFGEAVPGPASHRELRRNCYLSLVAQIVKNLPAILVTWVRSLGWEDPLEEGMATHSSILAWRVPWTEEPGRLQSITLQRVGHD